MLDAERDRGLHRGEISRSCIHEDGLPSAAIRFAADDGVIHDRIPNKLLWRSQGVEVTEVGRRLGVRYAVRGTVRRDGDRVRITARLADTVRGSGIWGERYDRVLAALEIARARWGDAVAAAEQARTS